MMIKKILIADDEQLVSEYLSEELESIGYSIYCAADGIEAYELSIEKIPDLILLDVLMPKQDGLTTCKKLKNDPRTANIPIVMLSAKAHPEEIREGYKAGADSYLMKPFSFPGLLAEIERWKNKKR